MVVLQSLVPAAWVLGLVLEAVPCFAVDTPWPPVPPQEDYTVSDVPIHVQPISVIKGLSNQTDKPLSGNDVLNFTKVGDTFTRKLCKAMLESRDFVTNDFQSTMELHQPESPFLILFQLTAMHK